MLRRHAQLLADAGVDALVLDVTNAATYDDTWKRLGAVYADLRAAGNRTPAISFIANSSSDATVQHLYDVLYSRNECAGLIYEYQGKPLMMAARGDGLSDAAKGFFTFRQSWAWTDPNGWYGDGQDKWPWLENFPQKGGWHESAQTLEEMPVGVAQHPTGNYGRSYHGGAQPPLDASYGTPDTSKGLGFQEQWDRALEAQPNVVFVTQCNEWIAQRFVKCGTHTTGATQFLGKPLECGDTHFIDDFNQEFSRDIEPMRGGHEDAYYYQLVANVRFKGARETPIASASLTSAPRDAAAFASVGPEYLDDVGDVAHRNALGFAGPERYEDASGRNDLVSARVARVAASLHFYVETASALSPSTDERWMVLWLDTDGDANTGGFGFDYAVNRSRRAAFASVERCESGAWKAVASAEISQSDRRLALAVTRSSLGLPATSGALTFRFKWTDNVPEPLRVLELLQRGDSAPNGRFMYRYRASVDQDSNPMPSEGGGASGGRSNGTAGVAGVSYDGGVTGGAGSASGTTGTSGGTPSASQRQAGGMQLSRGLAARGHGHRLVAAGFLHHDAAPPARRLRPAELPEPLRRGGPMAGLRDCVRVAASLGARLP